MKSDVYFIETTSDTLIDRCQALSRLLSNVKPFSNYKENEFIPVKITLGDTKCAYHLDPELVKTVINDIKKNKVKPFLFDTNVIYKGSRTNAVDHLTLVQNKGYAHSRVGAPFIIADGLFGNDGIELETGTKDIIKIRVPSFVGMVDSIVVLSHATGHIISGYAGAVKNIAMGIACKPTKQVQHSSIKPSVIKTSCTSCGLCVSICPKNAISFIDGKAYIDQDICIGCGECLCACKFFAIKLNWHEDAKIFCRRLAIVAKTILSRFKNTFFINFLFDITKECDCISVKNEPIICPNLGILASGDPISIDKAAVDMINKENCFSKEHLSDSYETMLEYGSSIGLGSLNYNLIKL